MAVSSVGMSNALATLATDMKTNHVQSEIALAVLKQIQAQQEQQAAALMEMIRQAPGPAGTGQYVNILV